MKQSRLKLSVVAVLAILLATSVGVVGCKKATGGGKVTGLNGEKITLGFQMRCENIAETAYLLGEVQFKDHDNNVAFHGVIDKSVLAITDGALAITCEQLDEALVEGGLQGIFGFIPGLELPSALPDLGTYTPQPQTLGDGGDLSIMVLNDPIDDEVADYLYYQGLPKCPEEQEMVIVQLRGGIYDGYVQGGCLDQGNLTVFEE